MNFSEKLRDPRWQKKRLEIFRRDEWKCQCCFLGDSMLAVHHLIYKRNTDPWDYPDNLLLTLCKECHGGELERPETEGSLLYTLREKGFLCHDLMNIEAAIEQVETRNQMYIISHHIEETFADLLKGKP